MNDELSTLTLPDEDLVQLIGEGNQEALHVLGERYAEYLRAQVSELGKTRAPATELDSNEMITRCLQRVQQEAVDFDSSRASVREWLLGLLRSEDRILRGDPLNRTEFERCLRDLSPEEKALIFSP